MNQQLVVEEEREETVRPRKNMKMPMSIENKLFFYARRSRK